MEDDHLDDHCLSSPVPSIIIHHLLSSSPLSVYAEVTPVGSRLPQRPEEPAFLPLASMA